MSDFETHGSDAPNLMHIIFNFSNRLVWYWRSPAYFFIIHICMNYSLVDGFNTHTPSFIYFSQLSIGFQYIYHDLHWEIEWFSEVHTSLEWRLKTPLVKHNELDHPFFERGEMIKYKSGANCHPKNFFVFAHDWVESRNYFNIYLQKLNFIWYSDSE